MRTTGLLKGIGVAVVVVALAAAFAPTVRSAPQPVSVPLCANYDGSTNDIVRASVPEDTVTNGSVFCRVMAANGFFIGDPGALGLPDVLNQGVVQAVDVFALGHDGVSIARFNHAIRVCLKGSGRLLYMDATLSPRVVVQISSSREGDYLCATIPNAGTLVLTGTPPVVISAESAAPAAESAPPQPSAPVETAGPLDNCKVTTRDLLNLRTEPTIHSEVITVLPYDVRITALERTISWYYVDYLGQRGWVSARFVTPSFGCGD